MTHDLPQNVEETVEYWKKTYSVEDLQELGIERINSKQLLFENEVDRLKARYRRGRLVSKEMVEVAGREHRTEDELQQIRRRIENEANEIRMNFRRAEGRAEKEGTKRKIVFLNALSTAFDSARDFVLSLLLLLRKLKFW